MAKTLIARTIWMLALVSLFTDMASEMLYPVMPVYLQSIGFSILLIGILEGLAEAVAGLSKGYFGQLSDLQGKRLPFVRAGYLLSAVSKPMLALFGHAWWVFTARTVDRLGKGLRTGARDAMLSDASTPEIKGRVFGLHRAFDTLGAVLGPLLALIYLHLYPGAYRTLFLIAFIPGILAVWLTFLIREKIPAAATDARRPGLLAYLGYLRQGPREYRMLLTGLIGFALFNSSDVFLLLKIREAGLSDQYVIGTYILYNLVFALAAYPMGRLADHIGLKRVLLTGLLLFALAYAGMGLSSGLAGFIISFVLYGLYAAATEGISKAWISTICPKNETATAIGAYTSLQSIAALLASSLAGWLWFTLGSSALFGLSAVAAVIAAGYLAYFARSRLSVS